MYMYLEAMGDLVITALAVGGDAVRCGLSFLIMV